MKKVSVITVNFNQALVTEALLTSIFNTNTYPDIEIVVVDNGSSVNMVPQWSAAFANVTFLRSDINLGFAGGNNLGIKAATGDYFFLVNNDTEFTPDLVKTLVEIMDKNERIGIISPKIRYFQQPDMIQYVGFTPMNYFTARNQSPGQFETDRGQYDEICGPTGFCHGAAMMLRREAVEKAGPMNETFFLYYEEMDWNEHIKRAGFEAWVCTKALIFHKESVSVGKKSDLKEYFMNRNRILFMRRNAPKWRLPVFYLFFILFVTPRNVLAYVNEKNYTFISMLFKAIWWNITNSKTSADLGYPIKTIA